MVAQERRDDGHRQERQDAGDRGARANARHDDRAEQHPEALGEFTAVHGPDLVENIKILEKRVNDALQALDKGDPSKTPPGFEGLDEHQLVAIRDAITNGEIQFEIVLTEDTNLGAEGNRDDSVVSALRSGIEGAGHGKLVLQGKGKEPNTTAPERVDPKWVKQATDARVAEEKAAKKPGPSDVRQARDRLDEAHRA